MKRSVLLAAAFIIVQSIAAAASAEDKVIEKVTLKPGEKKEFSIPSTAEAKLGYMTELSIDQMKSCKNGGIVMTSPTLGQDFSVSSSMGTAVAIKPEGGAIKFALQNAETFPIPLEVTQSPK
jgi:hypothetical protein